MLKKQMKTLFTIYAYIIFPLILCLWLIHVVSKGLINIFLTFKRENFEQPITIEDERVIKAMEDPKFDFVFRTLLSFLNIVISMFDDIKGLFKEFTFR